MSAMSARRNEALLRYLAAGGLVLVAWLAFRAVPFYPQWLGIALALGIGTVTAFAPSTGSVLFVLAVALPVTAADLVVGLAFLLMGLVATQYLGSGKAGGFILAALGVALVPVGGAWAAAVLAGYLLGHERGALSAMTACITVVGAGIALGVPAIESVATGGVAPGLLVMPDPATALGFGWVAPALKAADPGVVADALMGVAQPGLVAGQVAVWALAALTAASFRKARTPLTAMAGAVAALAVAALGSFALDALLDGPVAAGALTKAVAASVPLTLAGVAAALWVFPARAAAVGATPAAPRDVDDLLRQIASAEDELASRHTTEAVVLITDMKSFSAMTEDIGSVASAKIVQRHRDLLLPIIESRHGRGTPTGGDGLVAAFAEPRDAVAAAIDMQRALEGYTGSDRSPHELSVRIGIASGEVVLDAAGCPFLGSALNLAARVMDLADGGRVMSTGPVASRAELPESMLHRHGDLKLKNIVEPVAVTEVLWHEGMAGQEIRAL